VNPSKEPVREKFRVPCASADFKFSLLLLLVVVAAFPAVAGSSPGEVGQLRVTDYDSLDGTLSLTFDPACESVDHHIEFGPLNNVGSFGYTGQDCDLGSSGSYDQFNPGPRSYFFLLVGDDGISVEGSYGTSSIASERVERPENLVDPVCAFTQTLIGRCDLPLLEMATFRPLSEAYGAPLQRHAVAVNELLTPGVGIRVNGDDDNGNGVPDRDESTVIGENDLIEVVLTVEPATPPPGQEYVLRRTSGSIRIWNDSSKQTEIVVDDETILAIDSGTQTVWVENHDSGVGDLEFLTRSVGDQITIAGTAIHFAPLTSIVIALGGEGQSAGDPPPQPANYGTFNVAIELYKLGYDVHMYDEDLVGPDGTGAVYDELESAISERGVTHLAIFGYSHGAGSTNDLARRLDDNRGALANFSIDYTAYVDAIDNTSDLDIATETELPPSTAHHINYYENPGCGFFALCGGPIAGAALNLNVTTTPWGNALTHFTIDDAPEVRSGIRDSLIQQVTPW
jgi:hypothetical protein